MRTKVLARFAGLSAVFHLRSLWLGVLLGLMGWGLVACQKPDLPQGRVAVVQYIVNGQTIEVLDPNRRPALIERVRLIGLDAPDLEQTPWGSDAKQYLEERLLRQSVLLESDVEAQDRFERRLAYVWLGQELINEVLISEGYALAVARSPNLKYDQRLTRAQEKARLLGLGIWNPSAPLRTTPEEFRAEGR